MVKAQRAIGVLAFCAMSASPGSAQTIAAPVASRPTFQAPNTAANLLLPLRGDETLVPTMQGCGILLAVRPSPSLLAMKKGKWIGACRFGLLHGSGLEQWYDNYYSETEYRYGIAVNGRTYMWSKMGNRWNRDEFDDYRAITRPGSLSFRNWSLPADKVDGNSVQLRKLTFGSVPGNQSNYSQGSLHCGGPRVKVDRQILDRFPAAERKQVMAGCGIANNRLNYIKYELTENLMPGATFPDGKSSRVVDVRLHLCLSLTDCRQAWDSATAAEWPEIQRRKADWIAAQEAAIEDWERRMAPLEMAFAARIKRYAARPRKAR